jgi:hypothetical protein
MPRGRLDSKRLSGFPRHFCGICLKIWLRFLQTSDAKTETEGL